MDRQNYDPQDGTSIAMNAKVQFQITEMQILLIFNQLITEKFYQVVI